MRDNLTPEWMQQAMDSGQTRIVMLRFSVEKNKMLVVTGDSGGGPGITFLELSDPSRTDPAFHRATFRFVMDDKYQPSQPRYDPNAGTVEATYPMSALAGMAYVIRTGSSCTYTKYDNGNAIVDVRNA